MLHRSAVPFLRTLGTDNGRQVLLAGTRPRGLTMGLRRANLSTRLSLLLSARAFNCPGRSRQL